MKKLLGVAVIAFALFYLLTQPQAAAEAVRGARSGSSATPSTRLVTFITALFR